MVVPRSALFWSESRRPPLLEMGYDVTFSVYEVHNLPNPPLCEPPASWKTENWLVRTR